MKTYYYGQSLIVGRRTYTAHTLVGLQKPHCALVLTYELDSESPTSCDNAARIHKQKVKVVDELVQNIFWKRTDGQDRSHYLPR